MANYATSSLKLSDTYVNTLPYNTCSTAAATAAKTVAAGTFALETGAMVVVKFTVTNTAANPTLNVSSTGAKAIYYNGAAITADYLKANKIYQFVYNGTQWDLIGDVDTNTKNTAGSTNTSSKIYLIGATSQAANPQTYSHDTVYVDTSGKLVSNGYTIGSDDVAMFTAGWKIYKSYTFPKETSKTYYVVLKCNQYFEEQKFYLKTVGNNTQYVSLVTINARNYMSPTIHGQTIKYNGSDITEIAVHKNTTTTSNHDVVLTVKTNSSTTTVLAIYSNNDFALDETCISNTAPTGAKEASYVPNKTDTMFTTGAASIGGNLTVSGTITSTLKGNADTATKATQDGSGNVITSTYATKAELNTISAGTVRHTISQTDITAGTTPLAAGELYLVYE